MRCHARGFTLIELIMVIVLLGTLAIFVAPRFAGNAVFNARGFHDETLAYLRYAQKSAVAQRRTVCVTFTANTVSLSQATAADSWTCDGVLSGPRGERPAMVTARPGVQFQGGTAPGDFRFDSLGQPVNATGGVVAIPAIQVEGASAAIAVETRTGYIHE